MHSQFSEETSCVRVPQRCVVLVRDLLTIAAQKEQIPFSLLTQFGAPCKDQLLSLGILSLWDLFAQDKVGLILGLLYLLLPAPQLRISLTWPYLRRIIITKLINQPLPLMCSTEIMAIFNFILATDFVLRLMVLILTV